MMSTPRSRDPFHEPLREVRRGLLRLHKTLVDAERTAFQSERGAMSGSQFLQALTDDPALQWLRPYSGLIVEIDTALASRDRPVTAAEALAYTERVTTLVSPGLGVFASSRLDEIGAGDGVVRFARGELMRALATALATYRAHPN